MYNLKRLKNLEIWEIEKSDESWERLTSFDRIIIIESGNSVWSEEG